jgi:alpha-tubulin suppressor-like RCC1 family protein
MKTNITYLFLLLGLTLLLIGCREHTDVKQANAALDERRDKENAAKDLPHYDSGITKLSIGKYDSCVIKSRELYCWGTNTTGAVGNGTLATAEKPELIHINNIFEDEVTDVSVGSGHTCAVEDGDLFCWGSNSDLQLGENACGSLVEPCLIIEGKVTKVSAGTKNTCAIVDGALYCWGDNTYGQIGNGSSGVDEDVPQRIFSSSVTDVSVGKDSVCAIMAGALYCWGRNNYGQLGNGTYVNSLVPVRIISNNVDQVSVSMLKDMACALVGGAMKCWGDNSAHQLGDGTTTDRTKPKTIISSNVDSIDAKNHPCALVSTTLKCWGDTSILDTVGNTPTGLLYNVKSFATGQLHGCYISTDKLLFCVGENYDGSFGGLLGIGIDDDVYAEAPTQIILLDD